MKKLKPILIMTLVSAFAVLTVVNMNLAKPKVTAANTLDMLEIMTRAFDESEGGEPIVADCYWTYEKRFLSNHYHFIKCSGCEDESAHHIFDESTCERFGHPN